MGSYHAASMRSSSMVGWDNEAVLDPNMLLQVLLAQSLTYMTILIVVKLYFGLSLVPYLG